MCTLFYHHIFNAKYLIKQKKYLILIFFVFDDFGLLFNLKRTVQGKTVDYNTEQNRKIYRIDPEKHTSLY